MTHAADTPREFEVEDSIYNVSSTRLADELASVPLLTMPLNRVISIDTKSSSDFFTSVQKRGEDRYGTFGWGYEPEGVLLSKLNIKFFRNLFQLSTVALHDWKNWALFLTLPMLVAAYIAAGYYEMLVPGYLYTSLINDDLPDFVHRCFQLLGWVILITIIKTAREYVTTWLSNEWRKSITTYIHQLYMTDQAFYTLQISAAGVDNPDQRIVTDIREMTTELFKIIGGIGSGGVYEAIGNIFWYTIQVERRCGWYGVLMAYIWSALMAIVSILLINVVSPWVFRQERFEAVFRFLHMAISTRAEDIALHGPGIHEHVSVKHALDDCVQNKRKIINRQVYLNVVAYGYGYMTTFILYLSIGSAVFSGLAWNYTPERERAQWIAQTSGSFMFLLWGFTILIQMSTKTSDFVAYVTRVSELYNVLIEKKGRNCESTDLTLHQSQLVINSVDSLEVEKLQVTSPAGDVLLTDLSFALKKGDSLLIMASSGKGKSSILRVIRGLWPASSGSVTRSPALSTGKGGMFFLPQTPFLAYELTLKQQVMYPNVGAVCNDVDDVFVNILIEVGLGGILRRVGGLHVIADWINMLSIGEQQRLCLARVLWHCPAIAVLDEVTASLDVELEKKVYTALKRRGVGILSVGHRDSLIPLHNTVIRLD